MTTAALRTCQVSVTASSTKLGGLRPPRNKRCRRCLSSRLQQMDLRSEPLTLCWLRWCAAGGQGPMATQLLLDLGSDSKARLGVALQEDDPQ